MEHVTKILNGAGLAKQRRVDLSMKIATHRKKPGLAVFLVGHDPASEIYVRFKAEASDEVGIVLETLEFDEDVSEHRLRHAIQKLNRHKRVHGIIVQLPLPEHFNPIAVMQEIDPAKDVDGFHPWNVGWQTLGKPVLMPATTRGIWELLQSQNVQVRGRHVVVVGASAIVGKPTALQFLNHGATVTVCHKFTHDLELHTRQADILISATGVAHLITADMVREDAIVIDAGIARFKGRIVGDVDFDAVKEKVAMITPVPGGVGPMTVVSLLENTYEAFCRIEGMRL